MIVDETLFALVRIRVVNHPLFRIPGVLTTHGTARSVGESRHRLGIVHGDRLLQRPTLGRRGLVCSLLGHAGRSVAREQLQVVRVARVLAFELGRVGCFVVERQVQASEVQEYVV
jgi:hypothetical protein